MGSSVLVPGLALGELVPVPKAALGVLRAPVGVGVCKTAPGFSGTVSDVCLFTGHWGKGLSSVGRNRCLGGEVLPRVWHGTQRG